MKALLNSVAALILLRLLSSGFVMAQSVHTVRGQVADREGGAVKTARVTLSRDAKELRAAITDGEGRFVFNGVAAGRYSLAVKAAGFGAYQDEVTVGDATDERLKIELSVATLEGEVEIKGERAGLSLEADANRNAIVLRGDAIRRLPRDEQRLRQLLERMAGSFTGRLNISVNGLSGASLPPAATITEIRINSDPFSAAYHEPGSARVEIETKGGDDLTQGSVYFGYRNSALDARNTFSPIKPPLEHNDVGGWWSSRLFGPRSFIFGLVERQRHDKTIPTTAYLPDSVFNDNTPTPSKNSAINLRADFLPSDRHTFNLFFDYGKNRQRGAELTTIDLPERSFDTRSSDQSLQGSWRAIFSSSLINEAQLRLTRERSNNATDNAATAVEVAGSFNGGGPQCCPETFTAERLSIADNLIISRGRHLLKAGANVTGAHISGVSERDFGGTFYYPSLSFFRLKRPLYYTISVGEPGLNFGLWHYAAYAQDEIRLTSSFTLSSGLRYETQTYLEDRNNFAPRLGFAWSPFKSQNTVVRGGAGIFYQQLDQGPLSSALRYDGVRQRQIFIDRPRASDPLGGRPIKPSFNKLAADLRAPYQLHSAIGVEQRLPHALILTVNYNYVRGAHLFRSRNVNAPPPGEFAPLNPEFNSIAQLESSSSSVYHGLTAGFSQSFGERLSLFGAYTFSRAIDDGDGPDAFPMDSYNLAIERGFSATDVRHQFFVAALLALPYGFEMSPIVYYGSGRPYNITTGFDNNGDSVVNDRPDGVRRNSERGPNFASVDLRLAKSFGYRRQGSDQQLLGFEVAADATNLFNRVNLQNFIGIQTSPFFRRANAAHDPRQISVQLTFYFH
ncbi:MAG TPA: carboxypeptidase regulatory-like domain-containing protein [Blastocatellia bacterium]|nr:carboxypeptidase regulatory-like domain-containing protein [Blastocatellia bacterium]